MNLNDFIARYLHWILLFLLTLFLVLISFLSEGYYGGADNISHFFISRYSFAYPHLFLDPWGRPLYTILSSPFAQFGFYGIKLFNVLLGVFTACLAFLTAKRLRISSSYLVILFVVFTPLYCVMLFTALTEILFGFVLTLAIYFFFKERFIASAIAISFIPFARSEGFILFPLFFMAFLFRKKYKAIFFLLSGFLFFCLIGGYYYKDFFWPITHFPYALKHSLYTQPGSFTQFFDARADILGLPLEVLFVFGIFSMFYDLFSKEKDARTMSFYLILLLLLPFLIYSFFHSYIYWKGMGGSIGLVRVIAAVLPLSAIISLKGYQFISDRLPIRKSWKYSLLVITIGGVIWTNFITYRFPQPLGPEEKIIKEAADWVKNSPYTPRCKINFTDMNVPFFLELNPYDIKKCEQKWFMDGVKSIIDSSVFIWDAHFGPNECGIPLDSVMKNPHFRLLQLFRPKEPAKTFGGLNYEVNVFLKLLPGETADNESIRDILEMEDYTQKVYRNFDFERSFDGLDLSRLSVEHSNSGVFSFKFDGNNEYSAGFFKKFADLPVGKKDLLVRAKVSVYPVAPIPENSVCLVVTADDKKGSYCYASAYFNNLVPDKWQKVKLICNFPEIKSGEDVLKVYVWNPGKQKLYIDDLEVNILEHK